MVTIRVEGIPAAYPAERRTELMKALELYARNVDRDTDSRALVYFPQDLDQIDVGRHLMVSAVFYTPTSRTEFIGWALKEIVSEYFKTALIAWEVVSSGVDGHDIASRDFWRGSNVPTDPDQGVCPVCRHGMQKVPGDAKRMCPNCGSVRSITIN